MLYLSTINIQLCTVRSYYGRGMRYYNANKVEQCNIEKETSNSLLLSGVVKGSSGSLYRQYINIDETSQDGSVSIEGQCSCPVGYNCKHVVAICIYYKEKMQNSNNSGSLNSKKYQSEMEIWIDKLQEINEDDNSLKGDYFLTYRLFTSDYMYCQDELQFFKSKFLKNGSISQGTRLDYEKLINNYNLKELKTKQAKYILMLTAGLFMGRSRYSNDHMKIKQDLGYLAIMELIKTNRCYFDKNKIPLSFDNTKINIEYTLKQEKNEYILTQNINSREYKLIETNPPLIIDIKQNKIQQVNMDIDKYKQLLDIPKINTKNIGKVCKAIGTALPNINVKLPSSMQTTKIDKPPIAKLHICYDKNNNGKNVTKFYIDFKYDNFIVNFLPQEEIKSFFVDDGKVEIKRDLEFELFCENRIKSFGFDIKYENNNIYVELNETKKQAQLKLWKEFLNHHVDLLEDDGWYIVYDEEFNMKFESDTEIVVQSEDKNDWFSLSFNFEFNGISQPIAPLVTGIIEEFDNFNNMPEIVNIEVSDNHFIEIKTKQLKPIINTIMELFDKKQKDDSLKVSPFDSHLIDNLDEDIKFLGNSKILELSKKLKNFKGIEEVTVPDSFTATLRDYQQEGFNWLNFLYEFKFGGILADDMGLGKTIQTLVHLSKLKEDGRLTNPSLIVMPTSLIANWKNEAKKFTPNLSVLSLQGDTRAQYYADISNYDIILTTYPLIVRDKEIFDKHHFCYIILDEAQKIKNPKTKMTITIKTFKCDHRLALSGTPIENHLGELWSIFSFLMPGFLDTLSFFKNYYQTPIEKENNFQRQKLLNKRVKPFMIRRTKELVAHELPEKSEIIKYTQFDEKQSKLYESIRVTMEKKVREAVLKKGIGSSHITILDALLKLRQVCCDPSLLKMEEAKKVESSAKLELLMDLLDELLQENRKILLFSQFTSMLSIIEDKISKKGIKYTKLTGSTKKREDAILKFTKGDAQIFLISLKAGGVGLNLVEADTVIHYDPWWNPAVENQATDRAYRIGQNKAVFVYKLIVENTIEQKILELQKKKQIIQDGIYDEDKQQKDIKFGGDELMELLK